MLFPNGEQKDLLVESAGANVPVRVPETVVEVQVSRSSVRPIVQVAARKEQKLRKSIPALVILVQGFYNASKNEKIFYARSSTLICPYVGEGLCPLFPHTPFNPGGLSTGAKVPGRVPETVVEGQESRSSGRPIAQGAARKELSRFGSRV